MFKVDAFNIVNSSSVMNLTVMGADFTSVLGIRTETPTGLQLLNEVHTHTLRNLGDL